MAEIPEEIRERLEAAERVCVMYSWTSSLDDSDRPKALFELWRRWTEVSGNDCSPAANPDLSDELIGQLARQRDETRERTLAVIRDGGQQHGTPDPASDPSGAPPIGEGNG
jgi:hypothetical protein